MVRKLVLGILLILFAIVIDANYNDIDPVHATSSHAVHIDYNTDSLSDNLPPELSNSLFNATIYVADGDKINPSQLLSDRIRDYYLCTWTQGDNIIDTKTYIVTTETILVATWTQVDYNITYAHSLNEKAQITNFQSSHTYSIADGKIDYYSPIRPYYHFLGWYDNAQFLGDRLISKQASQTGDMVLYPKFVPIEYTINYNTFAQNTNNPLTYNYEDSDFVLLPAQMQGYIFKGWFVDSDHTNPISKISSGSQGDLQLYAKWEAVKYNVTYILPDGSQITLQVEYMQTAPLPAINKSFLQIVTVNRSRSNIVGDTTIEITLVSLWYVYLLMLVALIALVLLILWIRRKRQANLTLLKNKYKKKK